MLDVPNGLARGVRSASDFLMALQLTGAAKADSIANLQLRLPVVVIGGGLTAIDAATESLAYYAVQVEKFLQRFEELAGDIGEGAIRERWDDLDREVAEEFLAHARALREERERAREDAADFKLDGKYFTACDEDGRSVEPAHGLPKPPSADVLLSRLDDGRFISFFGDLHPSYFGNVVKAMASARQGYPKISRLLHQRAAASSKGGEDFFAALAAELLATVHSVQRLTPTIVEVVIKAPAAARKFRPGQFYRLQNFESLSRLVARTRLHTEGLAMTGAWVDADRGLVSCIVLEMGGSSNLVAALAPGEPVILMGPTGTPTHIESGETVLLAGGGLGNAVLFSIGQAFRACGSRVLYFAGYQKVIDRYKIDGVAAPADVVVWCCDEAPGFAPRRPQDRAFVGNIVQAMEAYATGRLGEVAIRTEEADRIIAIGSDRMMAGVAKARHDVLKRHLKPNHCAIGSINSPMQCMMKEICAQCLQVHRDVRTGKSSVVFSCFNQDQPLDAVDFGSLNERLKQNALQEKVTAQWLEHCARESA